MGLRGSYAPKKPIMEGHYIAHFVDYREQEDRNGTSYVVMHLELEDTRQITLTLYPAPKDKNIQVVYSQTYEGVMDSMFRQFCQDKTIADSDEDVWEYLESEQSFDIWVTRTYSENTGRYYTNYHFNEPQQRPQLATTAELEDDDDDDNPFAE